MWCVLAIQSDFQSNFIGITNIRVNISVINWLSLKIRVISSPLPPLSPPPPLPWLIQVQWVNKFMMSWNIGQKYMEYDFPYIFNRIVLIFGLTFDYNSPLAYTFSTNWLNSVLTFQPLYTSISVLQSNHYPHFNPHTSITLL